VAARAARGAAALGGTGRSSSSLSIIRVGAVAFFFGGEAGFILFAIDALVGGFFAPSDEVSDFLK
jgi:hypothetical protein